MDDDFTPQPDSESADDHDNSNPISRRDFLRGTTAVVLVSSIAVLVDCGGEQPLAIPPPPEERDEYNIAVPVAPLMPVATDVLKFFTPHEAATVEAFTARIIPGDPNDPGAKEAGVFWYIDNLLTFRNGDDRATYRTAPFAKSYEGDTPPPGLDTSKVVPIKKSELPRYSYQAPNR